MNYLQATEWLEALTDPERRGFGRNFARRMNLDTVRALLSELGDPHLGLRAVHIAGTKGKGSVAALVEAAVRAAGYRTALFTSPHLRSWRERVRFDGRPVSEQELAHLATVVRPAAERVRGPDGRRPSFFEVYFALAMVACAERPVDLAVVETGLGGRLDATNVLVPLVSVITSLGLDHTQVLGETIEQIAAEKAGIIKVGVPVVSAPQPAEAMAVLQEHARQCAAPLVVAQPFAERAPVIPARPEDFPPGQRPHLTQAVTGRMQGEHIEAELPLLGAHQLVNLGVAAATCEQLAARGVTVDPESFARGLARAHWPGRMEVVEAQPWLVLDCAHNPDSARALFAALRRHLHYERLILVLGVSREKDVAGIARELAAGADHVILTQAQLKRALEVEALAETTAAQWRSWEVRGNCAAALARARELAGGRDAICVTGSVFLVAEAMELLSLQPFPESG